MTNCFVVALFLWLRGYAREYFWARRSHVSNGRIPHFGYFEKTGFRTARSIEYRPTGQLWSKHDWGCLFRGEYVVISYTISGISRFNSLAEAIVQ